MDRGRLVKRRPLPENAQPGPARLRHYDPADWPDAVCHPACAFWEERRRWRDNNPDISLEIDNLPEGPWHPERI